MTSPEIDEGVHRARDEALRPLPWPARPDTSERRAEQLADGSTRYLLGTFYVDVAPDGRILVNRDDWLSKYSLAIDGTLEVSGKFTRLRDGKEVAIENENLIRAGETLVHRPTAEQDAKRRRIDAQLQLQSPDRPMTPDKRVEAVLEKSAEIVGGAIKRTPFAPFTSAAEKIDQAAIERLKGYARRRLREVDAISEAEKQAYFLTSTRATTAILLYEFASGEGHDYRKFDESHAIVQDIKASAFSEEVLRVFGKLNEGAPSIEHLVPLDDRFYGYSFSPDHAGLGESIEKHAEAFEKLGEGSDLELFLGGVSYKVTIDAPNDKLNVLVRDSKTRPSLLLHGAEERERALFKETPLGSTVQEYAFSLPIPWELIYDAGPRAKP